MPYRPPVTEPALLQDVREALTRLDLGTPVTEPEPVAEAWSNDVLKVVTGRGTFALKIFSPDLDEQQEAELRRGVDVESTVLRTGEVPMPAPVADPSSGSTVIELAPSAAGSRRFVRAHEWVDGEACSHVPPSVEIVRDVGRSLGVIHALHLPGGDSSGIRPVDLDRWQRAVAGARRRDLPWAEDLTACGPLVEELAIRLEQLRRERRPMRTSHRDMDPKNAVVRADGRVALTDWDHAGPVLAEVELVVAGSSFAGVSPDVDEDLFREFVAAYRDAGGDAGTPDGIALSIECSDVDWLLRNVEGCLREQPGEDDELRQRLAPALVGSFAAQVAAMERWARLVEDL